MHIAGLLKRHLPQPFIPESSLIIGMEGSPEVHYLSPYTPESVSATEGSWAAGSVFQSGARSNYISTLKLSLL